MDERFIYHRFIATRISLLVGVVIMALYLNYYLFFCNEIHWDLFIILGSMVLAKLGTMLFLKIFK